MANGLTGKIAITAIITTAVGLTGGSMYRNTEDHVEIRHEIQTGDEKVLSKVMPKIEKIEDTVMDIRLEQREIASHIKRKL